MSKLKGLNGEPINIHPKNALSDKLIYLQTPPEKATLFAEFSKYYTQEIESSFGYPANYSLDIFITIASRANTVNIWDHIIYVRPRKTIFGLLCLGCMNNLM